MVSMRQNIFEILTYRYVLYENKLCIKSNYLLQYYVWLDCVLL